MRGNTVKDYKPLLSSAPAHSILNAQAFHYTNSAATDIRKTFARVRRREKADAASLNVASNVRPLYRRNGGRSD
jgi:hypothetical protein